MTLTQLSNRLAEIIQQNKDLGWNDRNELPIVIALQPAPRKYRQHQKPTKRFPVRYASSAMVGFVTNADTQMQCVELICNAHEQLS